MTTEQREAIERLEKLVRLRKSKSGIIKYDNCICSTLDLDTVLSLIKEQQKEIDKYKTLYERALTDLVKADKQIDLMADKLVEAHEWFYSEFDNFTKEDFIKYFADKAKGQ